MGEDRNTEKPRCMECRHFFITYEPSHPYGCRAMGFKGPSMPTLVVHSSSGMSCQLFEPKKKR